VDEEQSGIAGDGVEPVAAEQPDAGQWELPEQTGVAAVDEALQPLRGLDALPTNAHVEHYETVHRRLQDALADLDGS
jgi:hypothetical protein